MFRFHLHNWWKIPVEPPPRKFSAGALGRNWRLLYQRHIVQAFRTQYYAENTDTMYKLNLQNMWVRQILLLYLTPEILVPATYATKCFQNFQIEQHHCTRIPSPKGADAASWRMLVSSMFPRNLLGWLNFKFKVTAWFSCGSKPQYFWTSIEKISKID